MRRGERVLAFLGAHPWAILPEKLTQLCEIVEARLEGRLLSEEEIAARIGGAPERPASRRAGTVQVIPVFGVIAHRADLFTQASGGTSTEGLARALREAIADPEVSAIVLDINSPGGNVLGMQELADELFEARGAKPIVAVANAIAASGAYWLGAQADEFIVTPSGEVGSIGVFGVHTDLSEAAKREGVTKTFVASAPFKTEGNQFEPLSAEARAYMQDRVDAYHDAFVRQVARGRGAPLKTVREGYGRGRTLLARPALEAGMVDGIMTLDEVLARLAAGRKRVADRAPRAEETPVEVGAEEEPAEVAAVDTTPEPIAPEGGEAEASGEAQDGRRGAGLELRRRRLRLAEVVRR